MESVFDQIIEREECGCLVLSARSGRRIRRILHVNAYGSRVVWEKIKKGIIPSHQLIGCLELVGMGYEVALAEPLAHFNPRRRPFPHDLRLLKLAKEWLGPDDIIYAGHTLLYWLPMLKALGCLSRPIVSMTYAREELDFCKAHTGIVTLTPAAADQARKMAPKVKVAHLGWGVDPKFFPVFAYDPRWLFSCGIANRDFATLCGAASLSRLPLQVVCPGLQENLAWPATTTVVDGGKGWLTDQTKRITIQDLLRNYYPHSAASLIVIKSDPTEYTANGFTNLIEAMAVGQPVIMTKTGALPGELNIEAAGCGVLVPAGDPRALADAMQTLWSDPKRAAKMGERGRRLVEQHYNLERFSRDLHAFFESL